MRITLVSSSIIFEGLAISYVTLYGLKQAGRYWFEDFVVDPNRLGLKASIAAPAQNHGEL
jgi:hypothetical protein